MENLSVDLRKLLQLHENSMLDFKEKFPDLNDNVIRGEFMKDIAAFANTPHRDPAYLIFGVKDKNGRAGDAVGVNISKILRESDIQQMVATYIDPVPQWDGYTVKYEEKDVYIIRIYPSKSVPHVFNSEIGKMRQGTCPIRQGSSTRFLKWSEIRMQIERRHSEYSMAAGEHMAPLDFGPTQIRKDGYERYAVGIKIFNRSDSPVTDVAMTIVVHLIREPDVLGIFPQLKNAPIPSNRVQECSFNISLTSLFRGDKQYKPSPMDDVYDHVEFELILQYRDQDGFLRNERQMIVHSN